MSINIVNNMMDSISYFLTVLMSKYLHTNWFELAFDKLNTLKKLEI